MFIEAKDDAGGGDNWNTGVISRAKLQSNHHHQQTNTSSFYRPDALPVAQPRTNWRDQISYSLDLLTPSSPGVFQLCLWPLIAPGCIGGGLLCLSSALGCQYPFTAAWNGNDNRYLWPTWSTETSISFSSDCSHIMPPPAHQQAVLM